jgi:hypothetical protein
MKIVLREELNVTKVLFVGGIFLADQDFQP